jgi:hypothetical protein
LAMLSVSSKPARYPVTAFWEFSIPNTAF